MTHCGDDACHLQMWPEFLLHLKLRYKPIYCIGRYLIEYCWDQDMGACTKRLNAARYHAWRSINDNLVVLSFHEWMVKRFSKPITRV